MSCWIYVILHIWCIAWIGVSFTSFDFEYGGWPRSAMLRTASLSMRCYCIVYVDDRFGEIYCNWIIDNYNDVVRMRTFVPRTVGHFYLLCSILL